MSDTRIGASNNAGSAHRIRAPIWDGIDLAVQALARETGRRRAIVLVTDGLASGNRIGFEAAVDRAAHADVAVFVVGESWGAPRTRVTVHVRDRHSRPH